MSACCGPKKTDLERELEARNRDADALLKRARRNRNAEIKLLLLGTGESGKSTFAKQMRILYADKYTKEEKAEFTSTLMNNTLVCMKTLVLATRHFSYEFAPENEEAAQEFVKLNPRTDGILTVRWVRMIKQLWKDRSIQKTYKRRNEFQLMDSAKYFFSNMHRFVKTDYDPTEDDILRARTRTTGIVESSFKVDAHAFKLVDVGGQRSERRRWMHTFDDVTAVLFFASLTEFDMALYEDSTQNRMMEAMELFGEMSSSAWFNRSAFILFLNKRDLFEEKIQTNHKALTELFPDYVGGHDCEGAIDFIKEKFLEKCRRKDANILVHVTTATDSSNIKVIFEKARQVIISHNLEKLGFGRL